jgi:hypothetical protein
MSFVVPDACTLPTAERPLRLAEFDALFSTAVREVEAVSPTRARMRLSGPAGIEAVVRDLAGRETQCCSFFTFTVTAQPAGGREEEVVLVLEVEVPAAYAEVLAALAGRARAAVAGTTR